MCGDGAYLWTTAQAQEGYSTSGCRTYTLTRRRVEKFTRQAESCFWSGNIELTPGRPSESWWTALRIAASRHLLHSPSHKNTFSLQRYCTVLKIVRWCEQMLHYTCLTIPLRCGEHCCSPISFSYYVQLLLGNKSKPLSTFCAFPNMKKKQKTLIWWSVSLLLLEMIHCYCWDSKWKRNRGKMTAHPPRLQLPLAVLCYHCP